MAKCYDLEFGFHYNQIHDAPAIWGARAIYQHNHRGVAEVDLLWDRQSLIADSEDEKTILKNKLNSGAIKEFCKWAKNLFEGDSRDIQTFDHDGVKFWASTNASYGYLYITATLNK